MRLSRTEVLKDGASAIYGSDAVAGVVNFILLNGPGEKPYEGAELFALYGNTTDTDAHVRQVYLRGGVTGLDGKVAIAAEGEYYSRANLFSRRSVKIAGSGDTSNNPPACAGAVSTTNSPTYSGRVAVAAQPDQLAALLLSIRTRPDERTLINLGMGGTITSGRLPAVYAGGEPIRSVQLPRITPRRFPPWRKRCTYVTGRYKIFGDGLQMYGDIMYAHTQAGQRSWRPLRLRGSVGTRPQLALQPAWASFLEQRPLSRSSTISDCASRSYDSDVLSLRRWIQR